eukprot:37788-Chlamydomonas_euryale.AAC.2
MIRFRLALWYMISLACAPCGADECVHVSAQPDYDIWLTLEWRRLASATGVCSAGGLGATCRLASATCQLHASCMPATVASAVRENLLLHVVLLGLHPRVHACMRVRLTVNDQLNANNIDPMLLHRRASTTRRRGPPRGRHHSSNAMHGPTLHGHAAVLGLLSCHLDGGRRHACLRRNPTPCMGPRCMGPHCMSTIANDELWMASATHMGGCAAFRKRPCGTKPPKNTWSTVAHHVHITAKI